jgi:tetratricopeptide (TPR) repeat protein
MIETPNKPVDMEPLRSALRRTAAAARATTLRAGIYRIVWQWLALLFVLFAADLVFALPVFLRWLTLIGQAVFVLISIWRIARTQAAMSYSDEWAARQVEVRHPEVDNALINAIQFERILGDAPTVQAPLMEKELVRAGLSLNSIGHDPSIDRAPERIAARNAAILAVGWALLGVLFTGAIIAVMPRLFAPWMDDVTPPYSVTRFDVRPAGATVHMDDSLLITAKVSGQTPDTMALMVRTHGDWQSVPMDSEEPGTYSATLDSLQDDTWYYVQANTGRSARYEIVVAKPPVVTGLQVTYTYPPYTAKPPATEQVGSDGIHGLAGTTAQFHVSANCPISGGLMTIQLDGAVGRQIAVMADSKSPMQGTATFTIIRPGSYHLSLQGQDGEVNGDAADGKIVLDTDANPNVWIVSPEQDILVTPTMTVPIQIQAEDDEGVKDVDVHRMINDISDTPRRFPNATPERRTSDEVVMNLADLGVRPSDRIAYYATAYDNKPEMPDIGETETYTMKVVTPEEYQEALRQQRTAADVNNDTNDIANAVNDIANRQDQIASQIDTLQKQLAKHPGDAKLQKQLAGARAQQRALQQRTQKLAQAIQEYSQSPSGSPLEAALKKKLAQIAAELSNTAAGPMAAAEHGSPAESATEARAAAQQLAKTSQQMHDQVQQAVKHLVEIMPLYNDIQRFFDLLNDQGQLVLKARQFQQSSGTTVDDKARMDELASEQGEIRQALKQLQDNFRSDADTAQENFPKAAASARKIADEIDRRNIPELMQQGKDGFQQWDGPVGFENTHDALLQMQAMVSLCQGGQGAAKGELDIKLSQCLGQSGLGSSLDEFGMGDGSGNGQGMGFGVGGMQSGPDGQSGGTYAVQGPKAYTPSTESIQGTGGNKKAHHQNQIGAGAGTLAPSDVEVMKNPSQTPPKAGDRDSNQYPPEYRKMISDYFRSVAEGH